MTDQPILIAGGGIGGLAAACGLARKGLRSIVVEQAAQLGEIGAGLEMQTIAADDHDAHGGVLHDGETMESKRNVLPSWLKSWSPKASSA